MTDDDLPHMERAGAVRPVIIAVTCPACGAEEEIDALTGLDERRDGSYTATEAACVPCACGVLIEVPDIVVEFKR